MMRGRSHRAGPDTWVTAHILLDLLKERTVEELLEISANPVRLLKMPFGKHYGKSFKEIDEGYLDWLVDKSDMRNDPTKEDVIRPAARCASAAREKGGAVMAKKPNVFMADSVDAVLCNCGCGNVYIRLYDEHVNLRAAATLPVKQALSFGSDICSVAQGKEPIGEAQGNA